MLDDRLCLPELDSQIRRAKSGMSIEMTAGFSSRIMAGNSVLSSGLSRELETTQACSDAKRCCGVRSGQEIPKTSH
mgnify:FL=1